jgi:hypothetical protein
MAFQDFTAALGLGLMGALGLSLAFLAIRSGGRSKAARSGGADKEISRLMADISKSLEGISASSRMGGFALMQDRHAQVGRMLGELQSRLSLLDDRARNRYEVRAHRILARAARFGITLPPP